MRFSVYSYTRYFAPEITTRISSRDYLLKILPSECLLSAIAVVSISCSRSAPALPDLPKQSDRWVSSIVLDSDTKVRYIGTTRDYLVTSSSAVKELNGVRTLDVGDDIAGVRIGAIKCSFFWRNASYGGEQFMWRGRWGCQAGRSEQEVQDAVAENGDKRFDYVHVAPVRLKRE